MVGLETPNIKPLNNLFYNPYF